LNKTRVATHEYSDLETQIPHKKHTRLRNKKIAHVSYLASHEQLAKQQSLAQGLRSLEISGMNILFSWMLTILISILTSLMCSGILLLSDHIAKLRLGVARDILMETGSNALAFVLLLCYSVPACLTSSLLVVFVSERGGGSGIPDLKAFLNGNGIPGLFSFRTFVTRSVGLVLVTSAGLFVGSEGPCAHIGAICARGVARFGHESAHPSTKKQAAFGHRSDCEFVAQGVAIGIAASFGAPVGGILFSLEEASSFWSKELTWRSFVGCMIAAGLSKAATVGFTDLPTSSFIQFPDNHAAYEFWEMAPFCMIALLTGLLGAFFCQVVELLMRARGHFYSRRGERRRKAYRVFEVLLVTILTTAVAFWLPVAVGCRALADTAGGRPVMGNGTAAAAAAGSGTVAGAYGAGNGTAAALTPGLLETWDKDDWYVGQMTPSVCPQGKYSGLGIILMERKEKAIRALFTNSFEGGAKFQTSHLALACAVTMALTLITVGTAIPAGFFIPNILYGACLGRAAGQIVEGVTGEDIHPGVYALVGAAGMLAGYSRMTISIAMIMLELTQSTGLLLPVVVSILISRSVADFIKEDSAIDIAIFLHPLGSISLLRGGFDEGDVPLLRLLTAHDACSVEVQALKCEETPSHIMAIIVQTRFSGFPLISSGGGGEVVGLIRRERLLEALKDYERRQSGASCDKAIQIVTTAPPPPRTSSINLLPYADQTPEVKHWNTPLERAFRHFAAAGLRHLCLVDEMHRLVGILTRSDLAPLCHPRTRESSARCLLARKQAALRELKEQECSESESDMEDGASQASSYTSGTSGQNTPRTASSLGSFSGMW